MGSVFVKSGAWFWGHFLASILVQLSNSVPIMTRQYLANSKDRPWRTEQTQTDIGTRANHKLCVMYGGKEGRRKALVVVEDGAVLQTRWQTKTSLGQISIRNRKEERKPGPYFEHRVECWEVCGIWT